LGTFSTHPLRCGRAAVTGCDERVKRAVVASRLADSALPVDGEFAMGEVRRVARTVASFCGHW